MGLNAVQQYIRSVVDGSTSLYFPQPLVAYIAPPNPGEMEGPTAYIWGATWQDNRATWTRGMPNTVKTTWQIDIYLMAPDAPDYTHADAAFPLVVDSVVAALRATPMTVQIADPDTSATSQIVSVGEIMAGDYAPVVGLEDQSWVLYQCLLRCQVEEWS